MNFGTTATLFLLIQQGNVRAIAFTGVKRSLDLPDVPTMIERADSPSCPSIRTIGPPFQRQEERLVL